jgi:LysR family transcriptional regulator, chromosome initiation inhibitor
MNMLDAKQLEALSAVLENGSFGAAASALSLTLAAVSLRIKSLETALGQRLLVRGKTVRATPAGQALLGHIKRVRLLESDLIAQLPGGGGLAAPQRWQTLSVAVNADSLNSWFLPGVAPVVQAHGLLLDIMVDDQDHTHDALTNGDVMGCVTTLGTAMRGCVAEPLGTMRYRCVAAPALLDRVNPNHKRITAHQLLKEPAVIYNRKDSMQEAFLAQHLKLRGALYPRHFVPSVDGFERAIELGLGWGMVPDVLLKARTHRPPLHDVLPGRTVDVALYWQHWAREPLAGQRLTQAVQHAARATLLQG